MSKFFKRHDFFHTPKDSAEIKQWIEAHRDPMEKLHLYTVWYMYRNLLAALESEGYIEVIVNKGKEAQADAQD